MTDSVFIGERTTTPAQYVGEMAGSKGAQPGLAVAQMPLVPPVVAQGAANAEGVGVLAGKAVCPLRTPLSIGISAPLGSTTILAMLSNGTATMSNIP
jgi:hypothetical protein